MVTRTRPVWLPPLALFGLLLLGVNARAQEGEHDPAPSSAVSFIDSALPCQFFRLRYDSSYDNIFPNRSEFFYAGVPHGPPRQERRVDSQDLSAYAEALLDRSFSAFVELPVRFLNPEINNNTSGFADMNAGFKYVLAGDEFFTSTFQFRVYAPTGAASRGLGTHHFTVEPALLTNLRITEDLTAETEFRYWIPLTGDDFAGDMVRYGLGLSYRVLDSEYVQIFPVLELIGWTFLEGLKSRRGDTGELIIGDARGNSIIDLKAGVRMKLEEGFDFYAGYGRALTGETIFKDMLRVEFRMFF
jgi:hypothetical protein